MTVRIQHRLSGQIIKRGVVYRPVEVEGWMPALLQMRVGTKARIVVPSNMAYGFYGTNYYEETDIPIPGNTTVVFEIEVEEVRKAN